MHNKKLLGTLVDYKLVKFMVVFTNWRLRLSLLFLAASEWVLCTLVTMMIISFFLYCKAVTLTTKNNNNIKIQWNFEWYNNSNNNCIVNTLVSILTHALWIFLWMMSSLILKKQNTMWRLNLDALPPAAGQAIHLIPPVLTLRCKRAKLKQYECIYICLPADEIITLLLSSTGCQDCCCQYFWLEVGYLSMPPPRAC